MKLNDLFLKDIARSIEGVVKADDVDHLRTEVEEYVLTNDAAKGVAPLLEEYTNYTNANGVWISGFFGSGKSHLLKMLAHLLGDVDGQTFPREQVSEHFLQKTDDEMLAASLRQAARIPAKSLLFNIDQKATLISKDQTDALLKVFVKVFAESRGYFGNDGAIARFEEDLDKRGQYERFKDAFSRISGIDWSQGREQAFLEGHNIDAAYAEVNGAGNPGIIEQYQKSYAVSIEDFADSVNKWLEDQEPNFRLNFFVDEVGQFIADDVKLMLNLQTIAESLNTKCRGRAWVFVTSQEDMDKVIGDRTRQQSNDFSKIQARFSTKVKLTSQDVEEVISKRLLQKNEAAHKRLSDLYAHENANFPTIFDFGEGSKTYRNYVNEERFVDTYPFVTYQIPMFQAAIEGLSDHNMFEGRNSSVGERSMLGVVQEVAKRIGQEEVGYLATFDQMFSGIGAALKSAAQSAILQAERHLPDPDSPVTVLANRLLKAMFLVKYVDSFKATPRNLTVLVYDRFGLDLSRLGEQVRQALNLLEAQSYVQRNGNLYEFLTNEEQEIEKEIKNVEIDSSEVSSRLMKFLQGDVLKTNRFKYAKNGQDFSFGYKLDDIPHGTQRELSVHFISPETSYSEEEIKAQSTGRDELRVVLKRDKRLMGDLRLLLKTEKYTKQRTSSGTTPSVQSILQSKQLLNADREKEFIERLRKAVGEADMIINASTVASSSQDAVSRVTDGFQELVGRTYNSLSLLGGRVYPEQQVAVVVKNEPGLVDTSTISSLTTPAGEMESWILQQRQRGEQVTVKKIVDRFETKPYGWDIGSIEVVLGWLVGNGKILLSVDANQVARTEAASLIRNTAKHAHLVVAPQKAYDQTKVSAFRRFCVNFFDEAGVPTDPTELARFGRDRLKARRDELSALVSSSRYSFVDRLTAVIMDLDQVCDQDSDWYLSEFGAGDSLLEAKEDLIDPIMAFVNGQQSRIYDEARNLLTTHAANLQFVESDMAEPVQALLDDPDVFRGNRVHRLKTAGDTLHEELDRVIRARRDEATAAILQRRDELMATGYFTEASPAAQSRVQEQIDHALARIEHETHVASILQMSSSFGHETYPSLLSLLADSPAQTTRPTEQTKQTPSAPAPTPPSRHLIVSVSSIKPVTARRLLESEADVEEYVEALRSALVATLNDGKRITL
ncbi:BREX system P-loop protein BrxC [Micrococcus luteus]|uniref:BREX system P-loop protein BrxC n=1 Tax=Micrococcus luteus TaxID=1270 RepID=UPI0014099133|nr:BREX system P-loop protein BrxC [Micrococcus luteus]